MYSLSHQPGKKASKIIKLILLIIQHLNNRIEHKLCQLCHVLHASTNTSATQTLNVASNPRVHVVSNIISFEILL